MQMERPLLGDGALDFVTGQDQSVKSHRIRHAKIKKWLVAEGWR